MIYKYSRLREIIKRVTSALQTGTVKWFNNAKGFGFILPEDGGADVFAHYSSVDMSGYKTLKAGQAVSYQIVDGPKGPHATDIQVIDSPSDDNDTAAVPEEATETKLIADKAMF